MPSIRPDHTGNNGGSNRLSCRPQELGLIWGLWRVHLEPGGSGMRPAHFGPRLPATGGHLATPKLRTFLEMGIQPRKMPKHTPQPSQGTGRVVREPNEPRSAPKLPGVGFGHALVCRRKGLCAACAELSATKTIEQWGREVICSKENLKIYHYAHARNSATRV